MLQSLCYTFKTIEKNICNLDIYRYLKKKRPVSNFRGSISVASVASGCPRKLHDSTEIIPIRYYTNDKMVLMRNNICYVKTILLKPYLM